MRFIYVNIICFSIVELKIYKSTCFINKKIVLLIHNV